MKEIWAAAHSEGAKGSLKAHAGAVQNLLMHAGIGFAAMRPRLPPSTGSYTHPISVVDGLQLLSSSREGLYTASEQQRIM